MVWCVGGELADEDAPANHSQPAFASSSFETHA